jgi:hypothetical protein
LVINVFNVELNREVMKRNMGIIDRVIRIAIAITIGFLFVQGTISGALGVFLMILSGVFVLTSVIGLCPLYNLVGIKTCRTK